MFKEATSTTTWRKHFYTTADHLVGDEEHDDSSPHRSSDSHHASGHLFVEGSGALCFGPKGKIHEILNVERYIQKWPLIPKAELHASSVQHPDDTSMRWLLHTRRVKRHFRHAAAAALRNLLAYFHQALASALKKKLHGCVKVASSTYASPNRRCLHWHWPTFSFWVDTTRFSEKRPWRPESWRAQQDF